MNRASSRRTTLTLPTRCLDMAEQIARERHLNLSAVVGEALSRGLKEQEHLRRSEAIFESYREAFAGFSAGELLLLNGIVSGPGPSKKEPARTSRRQARK